MLDSLRLIAQLEALAKRPAQAALADEYWHYGVPTPDVRRIAKQAARAFGGLSRRAQDQIVLQLLAQGSDEAAHLGGCLLSQTVKHWSVLDRKLLDCAVRAFKGWSITDLFCIEVLQPLLLRFPEHLLAMLQAWADDDLRWMRRASVVVFARKIGASGKFTDPGLEACERLVWDLDNLVRKGVGWALKDLMHGDRARVLAYVRTLRLRGVSTVITRYALQRVQGTERREILSIKPQSSGKAKA